MDTPADRKRLEKIAKYYCYDPLRSVDWEDLANEAICRSLDGRRKCPRSVKVMIFLKQTMRSIICDEYAEQKYLVQTPGLIHTGPMEDGDGRAIELNVADDRPAPDREVYASRMVQEILAACDHDPTAQSMIVGMGNGLKGEELRLWLGLDEKAFASARKRFRRRIDRLFPNGWKNDIPS